MGVAYALTVTYSLMIVMASAALVLHWRTGALPDAQHVCLLIYVVLCVSLSAIVIIWCPVIPRAYNVTITIEQQVVPSELAPGQQQSGPDGWRKRL
jgi:hypothetical protein